MGIELKNVTKRFGDVNALDDVSLSFGENRICGLLGNNGAGKTTLLNVITNRLYPSSGQVLLDGEPVLNNDWALGQIFMMGEENLYPEDMRVRQALKVGASFYPGFDMAYAEELSRRFGLNTKKKITALSTGYASIFRLVVALSANTPYLLLDEPVLGLDAQHRDMFYKILLEKYVTSPCTIVISTHLIQEAAQLIEHAVIIREGRVLLDMPTEELLNGVYNVSGPAGLVDAYVSGKRVLSHNSIGGLKTACVEGTADNAQDGLEISKVELQDYFISLMNEEDRQ